jgi:hypothetical protein
MQVRSAQDFGAFDRFYELSPFEATLRREGLLHCGLCL